MKLKDLLNKKKEAIKEVGLKPSGFKDYSTSNLASNIDQKWKDGRNMEDDLVDWFDASVAAGGTDLGDDLIMGLENVLRRWEKINDAYSR